MAKKRTILYHTYKSIMGFMGIEDFEAVVVEGVDAVPDRAETFKSVAFNKARETALML